MEVFQCFPCNAAQSIAGRASAVCEEEPTDCKAAMDIATTLRQPCAEILVSEGAVNEMSNDFDKFEVVLYHAEPNPGRWTLPHLRVDCGRDSIQLEVLEPFNPKPNQRFQIKRLRYRDFVHIPGNG